MKLQYKKCEFEFLQQLPDLETVEWRVQFLWHGKNRDGKILGYTVRVIKSGLVLKETFVSKEATRQTASHFIEVVNYR